MKHGDHPPSAMPRRLITFVREPARSSPQHLCWCERLLTLISPVHPLTLPDERNR
jgi:hypothetical protein